ncbi:MAG: MarR family transcriptional regulator [Bacteroidia bacterium]|nr:MarR family transcriptional regulator [Bacteroidia bacterium]
MPSFENEIKQSNFASEQLKAHLNVLFTANFLYNKITAYLKPFNLTHEQYNVLRILRGSHPNSMCQKDILSRMVSPSSNLTLIINKLLNKKWVMVEKAERDRREYVINISPAGLELLSQIDGVLKEVEDQLFTLSVSESFHLNALLDKLRGS